MNHMRTIPHIARRFDVSPFNLAAVIRAEQLLKGTYKQSKRKRGTRKKWSSLDIDTKLARAAAAVARWNERIAKDRKHLIKWRRRLKCAERTKGL